MFSSETILSQKSRALDGVDLKGFGPRGRGKVRDFYDLGERRLLITTDRQSAFDRVLGLIPFKGQVLNQLSQFWFEKTAAVVPNHYLRVPDPNVMVVRRAEMFPVEIVVRGYLSGITGTSVWGLYQEGNRNMYGLAFPEGMRKNQPLPAPIITPTSHAGLGGHDRPLSREDILNEGLVPAVLYGRIEEAALAVFQLGRQICRQAGLVLVDTKYEFGLVEGQVVLADEVHTPDSSRFWLAETYQERFERGEEPENFDKELLRLWLRGQGYRGEGKPPPLDDEITVRLSQRYIGCYERLTGREFETDLTLTPAERIERNLKEASF